MNSYNKKVSKYPFIVSIIYLISTVVIYFAGEYIWDIPSKVKLLAFLIVVYLGYYLGGVLGLKSKIKIRVKNRNKISVYMVHLFRFSCFFSIIAYVVMVNYYGHGFISLNSFSSVGNIYIEKALRDGYEQNYLVQFCSWFWLFTYFYIPIGITYYHKLKKIDRWILFITLITCIMYWLSIGTMKGIGDMIIQILPAYELKKNDKYIVTESSYDEGIEDNIDEKTAYYCKKQGKKKNKKLIPIILIGIFIFIFGAIQESRHVAIYGTNQELVELPSTIKPFVKNTRSLPIPSALKTLTFYISHGYTGLAYSLELPFEWTGMIGFSRSLTEIIESRLPIEISSITYLQRIQDNYGWHNGMIWSTIFPWFAGDVTFYGIPFIMMFLGYMFTNTWKKCLEKNQFRNVLDVVLFTQLCIMIIYIPCNNQIFQSRQSLFSIVLLLIMYKFVKVRTYN